MTTDYIITQYTNREEIHVQNIMPGCVDRDSADAKILHVFDNKQDAWSAFSGLYSTFKPYKRASDLFVITEYELEKFEHDDHNGIEDCTLLACSDFARIKLVKTNCSGNILEIIIDAESDPEQWRRYYYDFGALWNDYDKEMAEDYTPAAWAELDETKIDMAEKIQKECSCTYGDAYELVEFAFLGYEDRIMQPGQITYENYLNNK